MSQSEIQARVIAAIRKLLSGKSGLPDSWEGSTRLHDGGLGMDSLDTATLSVLLEREFGRDPYTAGIFPASIEELAAFYEAKRPDS